MFIKRFLLFLVLSPALFACSGTNNWRTGTSLPAGAPTDLEMYGSNSDIVISNPKRVSVLLPMTGPDSAIGRGIAKSVQVGFLKNKYTNISADFYDLTGNKLEKQNTILTALATNPDIIIGPVFAEDVRMLRDMKAENTPVISFTSDASALGRGVITMALMPAQSIEAGIAQMTPDGATGMIIFAPNTDAGRRMAGAAVLSGNTYDMPISGLFYYNPRDSDSIKTAAMRASMYTARMAANTRAREVLSDILLHETLTALEKSSINTQLEKLSKSDTIGKLPFDAVLFLGNADDTKTLASFLRYFDVAAVDARFYGTAIWDSSELLSDFTMTGARFAALPPISLDYTNIYQELSGRSPSRLDTFGFDASAIAIGALSSGKTYTSYLFDPSGYNGLDGLFRFYPDGTSQRALSIMELNGGGSARIQKNAPKNFILPIYNVSQSQIKNATEFGLVSPGINPGDYIRISDTLRRKYSTKKIGVNMLDAPQASVQNDIITILPEDDSVIITAPEFQPINLESVDRQMIDSVEIN